jgi:hypothetical protein
MLFLLAERNEGSWVIGLIFGAIWLIFSIVSAISKKQEEAKRQQFRRQMEAGASQPAPGQPQEMFQPRIARRTDAKTQSGGRAVQQPMRSMQQPAWQQPQKRPVAKRPPVSRETPRSAPRRAPPPIPGRTAAVHTRAAPVPTPTPVPPAKQDISATEIRAVDAKKPQLSVNAQSLHKWLRPATLRQQFMLTEVLQPPIALRPERE